MSGILNIERDPAAWTFILNRPAKRNALSGELVEELIRALDAARQADVRLLLFRGAGRNFSAGFDFTGYQDESDGDLALRLVRIEQMLQAVANWPGLTVAFAQGRNFGAGVDLFAACKRRYCTADATFRMPGLKFGLVLGTRRFRNIVGASHAHSMLAGARVFDGAEAVSTGFVDQMFPEAEWADVIQENSQLASLLDRDAQASLYRVLNDQDNDSDMANLVRSVARPGLKERMKRYLDEPG